MEKLELKHLAPYIPYGVRLKYNGRIVEIDTIGSDYILTDESFQANVNFKYIKPILRPLSDLTNGKYYKCLEVLYNEEKIKRMLNEHWCNWEYKVLILCFEEHVDVFGLIKKGLAIDINTLEK